MAFNGLRSIAASPPSCSTCSFILAMNRTYPAAFLPLLQSRQWIASQIAGKLATWHQRASQFQKNVVRQTCEIYKTPCSMSVGEQPVLQAPSLWSFSVKISLLALLLPDR